MEIEDFIVNRERKKIVIDVRSQLEFEKGHVPGAINIPLLNDEQRKIIGTIYKHKGKEKAIEKGWELVGPEMQHKANQAKEILKKDTNCDVYCARGGLRSQLMTKLFVDNGIDAKYVSGGYKTYRNWVLQQFEQLYKLIIIGGKTGSGKTEILIKLKLEGHAVVDLEHIANHKGSAYGGIEMPEQPSQERFENQLALELHNYRKNDCILVESESKLIGRNIIPDAFYNQFTNSNYVVVAIDETQRRQSIIY